MASAQQPAPQRLEVRPSSRWTRLGWIAPRTVAAWVLLDLVLRFVPLTWFPMRDFLSARHWFPPHAPFRPGLQVHSSYFEGDEAIVGNRPPTETRPPTVFTTNRLGFRWTPAVAPGNPPDIMVFRGFSFTWGAGLSDDETIAAVLSRELDTGIFDAARFHEDPESPEDLDRLMAQTGRPGLALYVHLEQNGHTLDWHRPSALDRLGTRVLGAHYEPIGRSVEYAKRVTLSWFRVSPLNALCVRLYKSVSNDRILPNVYRDEVVEFTLPDGRPLLTRRGDLERVENPPPDATVRARAEYIAWWRDRLEDRGIPMVVLLIPEKMSLYGPLVGRPPQSDPYLNRLERELQRRRVTAVNGLGVLAPEAPAELAAGRLFFYREDHHWNRLGVTRLGRAVAGVLRTNGLVPEPRIRHQAVFSE